MGVVTASSVVIAILTWGHLAQAAPKLERQLIPPNPGVGEYINFVVTVDTDTSVSVDEAPFPNVIGLEHVNTSTGVETRSMFTNGRFITKQSRSFTYQLIARKKGERTIPPIPFKIDGYVFRTQPLTFTVGDAPANDRVANGGGGGAGARGRARPRGAPPGPLDEMDQMEELFNQMLQRPLGMGGRRARPGTPPPDEVFEQKPFKPDESFFIQATTDKTKAYVGEAITTNFYLVTRGQVRDIDTLRYPDLKGFWKEDLEMATRLNFEPIVIEGVQYQRALLVSYALFPIHAGANVIDGYQAKCTVLTPSTMGFGRAYQFTKSSTPIHVDVSEVPAPKPADFTGAVGQFRTTAAFEPATGSVDQPVTLRVRFEGRGNAKLIELPNLNLPEGLEIYETKSQAKFIKDGSSYKEFDVLIIPRKPGRLEIPPVTISVFDPAQKTYVKSASNPLELTVTGQATTPSAYETSKAAPDAASPKADAEPGPPDLAGEVGSPPLTSTTNWIITGIVYALALGLTAFAARRYLRRRPRKASLALIVRARVARTRALASEKQWRRVGVELTNTLYKILGDLSEQGGASQDLARLLELTTPSLRNELAGPLADVLARCEALSFAPEEVMRGLGDSARVDQLIADFEVTVNRAIELAEI